MDNKFEVKIAFRAPIIKPWLNSMSLDLVTLLRTKFPGKYSIIAATYMISWITIFISLAGVGFPIANYMFNQVGVLDDLENGILLSKAFYNPLLLTLPDFVWIVSPFMNLINYLANSILITANLFECPRLYVMAYCSPSTYLTVGGKPFLINDVGVLIWFLGSLIIFSWLIYRITNNRIHTFLLSTSYPFIYALSRGNPDVLASIIVASLILSILNKRVKLSFFLVGVITAIKIPFGILFVPLIFAFPKLRNLLIFISTTSLGYLVPLIVMHTNGSIFTQLRVFSTLLERYNNEYAYNGAGLMHSTSILSFIKVAFLYISHFIGLSNNLKTYIFIIFFISAFFISIYTLIRIWPVLMNLRINKNPDLLINCALVSMVLVIILPGVSQDYRLALLIPFLAYLFRKSEEFNLIFAFICILLMSKNFLQITFPSNTWGTTVGALINPIVLLLLLQALLNKINKIHKLTL
jgi:hypothetical protein